MQPMRLVFVAHPNSIHTRRWTAWFAHAGHDVTIVAGMDRGQSGVIRGQLLICLVNGMRTYVGLVIFDVKYSLILAAVDVLDAVVQARLAGEPGVLAA